MKPVQVEVDPKTVEVEVLLHEGLDGAVQFEPIRAVRTPSADLLNVQCRMVSTTDTPMRGTYAVEFFASSGRRLSNTTSRPWQMDAGGFFLIEAQSDSADATRLILSVR